MLSILERQKYLKDLGFYEGPLNGIENTVTKAAYKALQAKYFKRAKDVDGIYGKDTEKLLINAWRVEAYTINFNVEEFRCKCGTHCTGYPALLDSQMLANLQSLRTKYGALNVTSGLRCPVHNKNVGGASGSRHMTGKAADIKGKSTATLALRKQVMNTWKTLPEQRYTYCNENGNYPNMGSAVHVDVN